MDELNHYNSMYTFSVCGVLVERIILTAFSKHPLARDKQRRS